MNYPDWLTKIPHFDKILHAVGCLFIYAVIRLMGGAPWMAYILVWLVAVAKEEIFDARDPEHHTQDFWDFIAGVGPVTVVFLWEMV